MTLTAYLADQFRPVHFGWSVKDRVATITPTRPAICMNTQEFERGFHAPAAKQTPAFEGN